MALGGTRIKKMGRKQATQCRRQEKLLNKKQTETLAARGAADIARTTQRKRKHI